MSLPPTARTALRIAAVIFPSSNGTRRPSRLRMKSSISSSLRRRHVKRHPRVPGRGGRGEKTIRREFSTGPWAVKAKIHYIWRNFRHNPTTYCEKPWTACGQTVDDTAKAAISLTLAGAHAKQVGHLYRRLTAGGDMAELTRFGISIDERLLERFDALLADKGYVQPLRGDPRPDPRRPGGGAVGPRTRRRPSAPSPWSTTTTPGIWPTG